MIVNEIFEDMINSKKEAPKMEYAKEVIRALEISTGNTITTIFNDIDSYYLDIKGVMWQLVVGYDSFVLKPVNYRKVISKIPYTEGEYNTRLNPMTMGYRLSKVIEFKENCYQEIDWEKRVNLDINKL